MLSRERLEAARKIIRCVYKPSRCPPILVCKVVVSIAQHISDLPSIAPLPAYTDLPHSRQTFDATRRPTSPSQDDDDDDSSDDDGSTLETRCWALIGIDTEGFALEVADDESESESDEEDEDEATRLLRFLVLFLGAGGLEDGPAMSGRCYNLGTPREEVESSGRLIFCSDLESA